MQDDWQLAPGTGQARRWLHDRFATPEAVIYRFIAMAALGVLLLAGGVYSLYVPHYPPGGRCLMTVGTNGTELPRDPATDPACQPRSDGQQSLEEALVLAMLVGGGVLVITGLSRAVIAGHRARAWWGEG